MEKQEFIEQATNKINSTIYASSETIEEIKFEEQDIYNHMWITIICKRSIFAYEVRELAEIFNDPLTSIYAVNDTTRISIYALIKPV